MGRRRAQENTSRRRKVLQLDTKNSVPPTTTNPLSGLVGQYEASDEEERPPLPDNSRQGDIGMDTKLADFLAEIDALDSESPQQAEAGNAEDKTEAPESTGDAEVPMDSGDGAVEAPEWHEILDPNTNCYYYWNGRTQEVTWEIPEALKNPPPPPPPEPPAEREPTLLEKLTRQEPETGQAGKDDGEKDKNEKDGTGSESGDSEAAPREDLETRIAGIVGYGSPGIVGYGSGEEENSNDESKTEEMEIKETEKEVSGDEGVEEKSEKDSKDEEADVDEIQGGSEEKIGTDPKKSESGDEGGSDPEKKASGDEEEDGHGGGTARERTVSEAKSLGEEEDDDDDLSRYQLFDDEEDEGDIAPNKDKGDVSGDQKGHDEDDIAPDKDKEDVSGDQKGHDEDDIAPEKDKEDVSGDQKGHDEDDIAPDKVKEDVSGDQEGHDEDDDIKRKDDEDDDIKSKDDERKADNGKSDSEDDESDRESDHRRKDSGSEDSADARSGDESDSPHKSEEEGNESVGSSFGADDLEDIDKQLEAELEQKKAELRNLELMDTQDNDSKDPMTEAVLESPDEISSADEGEDDSDILQLESDLKRKLEELGGIEGDGEVKEVTKRKADDMDEEIIDVDKLDDIPPKRRKTSDVVETVEVAIQCDPESLEAATSTGKMKEGEDMKMKITDLASTLTNKLHFLGITKRGLTKFQLLLLSMETRIQDWRDGHMESVHLLRKLETTDWELERYESEGAPHGWSCHWDRNHKQYYYMNQATGDSQWEYPIEAMLQEKEQISATGNEDIQAAFIRASSIEGAVDTKETTTTVVEKKEAEVKEPVSKKAKRSKTKVKKKVKKEPPAVVKTEPPTAEAAQPPPPPIPALEVAPPPIPALEVLAAAPPPPPEPEGITIPPPPPPPLEPYPPPPPDEPPPPGTEVETPALPPLPLTPPPPPPDDSDIAPPLPPMSPPPLPPSMEEQLSSLVVPPPPPGPPQDEPEDPGSPPELEPAMEPVPEEEEPPELPMEPPQEPPQAANTAIIGAPQIIYNQAEVSSSPQLYGAPPQLTGSKEGFDIDGEPMEDGTASPVISAQPTTAKSKTKKTKTGKTKKTKKTKDKKLLATNKIPHSLVQKWTQIKQEQAKEEEGSSSEEEDQAVAALKRIEVWKKTQLDKGKTQYNSNFEAIRGDWRERLKNKKGV